MPRPLKTSKEDLIKIYQSKPIMYNDLSKITNVSYTTICKIFKENNIKLYSKNKIYSPNLIEDYFKNIDDEYKYHSLRHLTLFRRVMQVTTFDKEYSKLWSVEGYFLFLFIDI